jgi:transmembrane sensor
MKHPSTTTRESNAEEHAALWAARLEGPPLAPRDRAALDTWLAENPKHRRLLSQYCQFSADLEEQLPLLVAAGAVPMPSEERPRRFRFGWSLLAAGALAAAAAVVLLLAPSKPVTSFENVATTVAQRQSVSLADGTRVDLNAHTGMVVDLTRTERRVRLAGEAFFAVANDSARPFVVETPHGSVRVTGTAFNVRSESPARFEVTVAEGSVLVRPAETSAHATSAPVTLGAGDRLTADAAGVSVQTLPAAALEDALAWRHGQVVFAGAPLAEALAVFGRYHGRGLTAVDAAGQLKVGGRFSLDDVDGFFAALEELFPHLRIQHQLSGTVRVTLREEAAK